MSPVPGPVARTLPVAMPLAYGYQFYAYPLAIQATQARTAEWVLSNFIQVAYDHRGQDSEVPFCFYLYDHAHSPWLDVIRATRSWYARADLGQVIRDALADGWYAYLVVDEYHVPEREPYQVRHRPHDILVHGFADVPGSGDGTFDVLGYDQHLKFRSCRIPQAALLAGHHALDERGVPDTPVLFYRLRAEADHELDAGLVAQTIGEYLDGADTSRHFRMLRNPWDRAYGVATYPLLAGYLKGYAAGELGYDIRHLQVLWEHKRMATARTRLLAGRYPELAGLVEPAERIERMALSLRNAMVRDGLRAGRSTFGDTAAALLDAVQEAEGKHLHEVLTVLLAHGACAAARARCAATRSPPSRSW